MDCAAFEVKVRELLVQEMVYAAGQLSCSIQKSLEMAASVSLISP